MRRKLRDNIWEHGFSYLKLKVCKNRYNSLKTIKNSTHPNIEYQKKQYYVDSEIDKDVKYFKSMSRGYHHVEKTACTHADKSKKPTFEERWEKKKMRHRRKRELAI